MAAVETQARPTTEGVQAFAEIMEEVKTLEPQQQEKLTFFVQGYVAAAAVARRLADIDEIGR